MRALLLLLLLLMSSLRSLPLAALPLLSCPTVPTSYAGAAYLAWMGIRALRSGEDPGQSAIFDTKQSESSHVTAARDGFMISVLNPKLAIFFIALFSQFVSIHLSNIEQLAMITTAAVIDGLWYCIVVAQVSQSWLIDKLQQRTTLLNKISGILFLALALRVVTL